MLMPMATIPMMHITPSMRQSTELAPAHIDSNAVLPGVSDEVNCSVVGIKTVVTVDAVVTVNDVLSLAE